MDPHTAQLLLQVCKYMVPVSEKFRMPVHTKTATVNRKRGGVASAAESEAEPELDFFLSFRQLEKAQTEEEGQKWYEIGSIHPDTKALVYDDAGDSKGSGQPCMRR